MLTRRSTLWVLATFGILAVAVGFVMLGGSPSERFDEADDVEQMQPHGERARISPAAEVDEEREPELRIRIQGPASLGAGQVRQARVHVEGLSLGPSAARGHDTGELLEIDVTVLPSAGSAGLVWVSPERLLLPGAAVSRTPIRIGVHSDVPCDAELGDLQVRVRRIAEDAEAVVATEGLPPVACAAPPPLAPKSVHDTDPDCGGSLRVNHQVAADGDAEAPLDEICVDTPPPRSPSEPSQPQRTSADSQPSPARSSARAGDEDGDGAEQDAPADEGPDGGTNDDSSSGGSDDVEGGEGERQPPQEDPAPTDGGDGEEGGDATDGADGGGDGGGGDATDGADGGGGGEDDAESGSGGSDSDGSDGQSDGGGGEGDAESGGSDGEASGGGGESVTDPDADPGGSSEGQADGAVSGGAADDGAA